MMDMYSQTFNTHKYIKKLGELGLPEPQAEYIIQTILESKDYDLSQLATKSQITLLEHEILAIKREIESIKQELNSLRLDMNKNNEDLRSEMAKEFSNVRSEMAKEFSNVRSEMAREFINFRIEFLSKLDAAIATAHVNMLKWILPLFLTLIGMVTTILVKVLLH